MLITCLECGLQVSDKALSCPHCGIPMNHDNKIKRSARSTKKRRRLPNGFGQIVEIKNRRLNSPFRAMVTVGKDENGKYKQKILKPQGYFKTYNEAYAALIDYNRTRNNYNHYCDLTVEDLYKEWIDYRIKNKKSPTSIGQTRSLWAFCEPIKSIKIVDLTVKNIKDCIDSIERVNCKMKVKSMLNLMLDYAVEYEYVEKNRARSIKIMSDLKKIAAEEATHHIPFTDDEIKILWDNIGYNKYVRIILFQIYSGWRPRELGNIRIENVNLEKWEIIGGMKTEAGKNRLVPIHPVVRGIVVNLYNEAKQLKSEYLINSPNKSNGVSGYRLTYDKYDYQFITTVTKLGLNPKHRAHDPRMTFVTMAKKYNVDEYAIKYIVGHAINDITEKVYTVRNDEWLHDEMKKIIAPVNDAM